MQKNLLRANFSETETQNRYWQSICSQLRRHEIDFYVFHHDRVRTRQNENTVNHGDKIFQSLIA